MSEEHHLINRSNWLRAAVLGANDGILSTASIAVGIAAATASREPIVLGTLAGMVAGAFSMAAGEYVSVSSQSDLEASELEKEQAELEAHPEEELHELKDIYIQRGLSENLALQVATELTAYDALGAHARDELGLMDINAANPYQAAVASGLAFTVGGLLPFMVSWLAPIDNMILAQYLLSILFLGLLGAVSAKTGGASMTTAAIRIITWGTLAMGATTLIGYLFGISGI